jgi:hypothetical protein
VNLTTLRPRLLSGHPSEPTPEDRVLGRDWYTGGVARRGTGRVVGAAGRGRHPFGAGVLVGLVGVRVVVGVRPAPEVARREVGVDVRPFKIMAV